MPDSESRRDSVEKFWLKEFKSDQGLYRVHSVGALRVEKGDHVADIHFLPENGSHPTSKKFRAGLLLKLRPGSTWQEGKLVHELDPALSAQRMAIRHINGPGKLVSASAHYDFFKERYFLPRDVFRRGWLIETTGECYLDGTWKPSTLLIPCPVAFIGYFANSGTLARMLLSFPGRPRKSPRNTMEGRRSLIRAVISWHSRLWFVGPPEKPRTYRDQEKHFARLCLSRSAPLSALDRVTHWYLNRHARTEAIRISRHLSRSTATDLDSSAHLAVRLPFRGTSRSEASGLLGKDDGATKAFLLQIHEFWDDNPIRYKVAWEKLGRRSQAKNAEGPLKKRKPTGPRFTAPPEGGNVSSSDSPKANQFPAQWDAESAIYHSEVEFIEVDRLPPETESPPRPIPGGSAPEGFAIGETNHSEAALPSVDTVPMAPDLAEQTLKDGSEEKAEETSEIIQLPTKISGFDHISKSLAWLREAGYKVSPLDEAKVWIYTRDARGADSGLKILGARITHATGVTCLLELEHKLVTEGNGSVRWRARTATILVTPPKTAKSLALLRNMIQKGWQNSADLDALLVAETKDGSRWRISTQRHPPQRESNPGSPGSRATTHARKLKEQLGDPPPSEQIITS